jgi:uncharacterized protein YjbI with pentapeptide repeats
MNPDQQAYNEQHYANRPTCTAPECTEPALSLADTCWAHLENREEYLKHLRRHKYTIHGFAGFNLCRVKLRGMDFPRCDFSGTDLHGADLANTDLSECILSGAIMSDVNLLGASLVNADLSNADLSNANLRRAGLSGASFEMAVLARADLTESVCNRTIFDRADMPRIFANRATFRGASFLRSNMTGAICNGTIFDGAYLESCDLTDADLREADLYKAMFHNADIARAQLSPQMKVVNERERRYDEAVDIYTNLKVNFRHFGRYDLAEKAYYREKVSRRYKRVMGKKGFFGGAAVNVLEWFFFDIYCGYGAKPWRVPIAMFVVWALFALYYYLLPLFGQIGFGYITYVDPGGTVPPITDMGFMDLMRSMYFSLLSISAVNFSNYEPYGWAKPMAGIETSFGIVSYIVAIFGAARKLWH